MWVSCNGLASCPEYNLCFPELALNHFDLQKKKKRIENEVQETIFNTIVTDQPDLHLSL